MLRKTRAEQAPTDKEIALRAYQIWEQEGRPKGRDQEHWWRAEQELTAQHWQEDRALRGWEKAAGILSKRHFSVGDKRWRTFASTVHDATNGS